MDGLPEDQRDSPEPDQLNNAGAAMLPPALPPSEPLLLRHASVSSLDESSQKFRHQGPLCSDRPLYRNPCHPAKALDGFRAMKEGGALLCDVTLVAGNKKVPAHRALLAACSPYFYAMFTNFDEKHKNVVTLQEVDPEALSTLIDYVYTSKVEVTEENVQTLLPAANLMQLSDVRDACCEFLLGQQHPSNALGIKAFADMHGCLDLLAATHTYIESHFAEVLDCDEFYGLTFGQVCDLIQSDTITVPSEEKVYESVLSWVNHDLEARTKHLPGLMEHVRLPLMAKDYLIKKVDAEGLFNSHPECKDFIIEALKFHLATSNSSDYTSVFASPRTRPRQPIGLPKVMLAIGGQAPKAVRSVECYDLKEERWCQLSDMPVRRCRCGVAVVRGQVYAVGGFNGSLRVRTVDVYDPTKDCWSSAPNMEARRSTLGVAVLNDHIYAVGGFDGSTGLSTAEVLDLSVQSPTGLLLEAAAPRRREWRTIASMSTRRSSVGVGVLMGMIYAVGGYDGNSRQCLASVEVFCPERDVWKRVSDMSARRSGAGVGVLGSMLFAVGGHDGPLVRKSVECYNPEVDKWTSVSEMNFCRRNAGVVTHNGLLYVVGGDDGTSNLQSVEWYNSKTDVWTLMPATMSLGRSYTGVCIIDQPDCA